MKVELNFAYFSYSLFLQLKQIFCQNLVTVNFNKSIHLQFQSTYLQDIPLKSSLGFFHANWACFLKPINTNAFHVPFCLTIYRCKQNEMNGNMEETAAFLHFHIPFGTRCICRNLKKIFTSKIRCISFRILFIKFPSWKGV